jgi:GntR family transcriptional regulator/MocR family aminotransferase
MLYIDIKRNAGGPLSQQIYHYIKNAVLQGTLQAHEKLPSSRELAISLNVSRNVVIESYEQLMAEGFIYAQRGSGTFVCDGLELRTDTYSNLSAVQRRGKDAPPILCSFRTGIPDLAQVPIKKWAHIYQQVALDIDSAQLDYQDALGDASLRMQLSAYLGRARGVPASPENIIITSGAAQSFRLLCQLIGPDEYALVENPLSYGLFHTLESSQIQIKAIPLDEHGMQTNMLPATPPKLIFTTPSHQFPTGVVLPAKRRIELIQYAKQNHAYIVEDDYDSEFRFDGSPIQSMQYLDPEHVIYVGTFSKTLMPALRIGYMVLPLPLREQLREAKYVSDINSPVLEQKALARFISEGCFEQHIRKMRKLYLKKRNYLIACLKQCFGNSISIFGEAAGLHFTAAFQGVRFDKELMAAIRKEGIEIAPMSKYCCTKEEKTKYENVLVFGYGNTPMESMASGVECLEKQIREHKEETSQFP